MIIQIKYLIDWTPLPHLISREKINYSLEIIQPLECRLFEYKDQSSQTEDAISKLKKKQLFLEYHPLSDAEKNRLEDLIAQLKAVVDKIPRKPIIPTKKIKKEFNHISIYEGKEDPKLHWFVCENFWDVTDITNQDKEMDQFGDELRHRALTWFMNYTEKKTRSKVEIKNRFLTFFKFQDITILVA
jgi:hypothetical protein